MIVAVKVLNETLMQKDALEMFVQTLKAHWKNRVWLVGNGGSASVTSHMSCDLSALGADCMCLVDNYADVSRIINDYGWSHAYARQMRHFRKDDVLVVASVHGGTLRKGKVWSGNLVKACMYAKAHDGKVLALLGDDGGLIKGLADVSIIVPHQEAGVVEGIHGVLAHLICSRLKEKK